MQEMQETRVWSLGWEDPWSGKWQTAPVFMPGKPHKQRIWVGYSPWGRKELGTTERLSTHMYIRQNPCLGKYLEQLGRKMKILPSLELWVLGKSYKDTEKWVLFTEEEGTEWRGLCWLQWVAGGRDTSRDCSEYPLAQIVYKQNLGRLWLNSRLLAFLFFCLFPQA